MPVKPVEISEQTVVYPTYAAGVADKNPMFFEKRVYQASSGRVYPLPFTDSVSSEKQDRAYLGLVLENEYLQVLVLPEIGGRIQRALDKTNNYDFIYHNRVIKPALVGLAGPWISGGIEFNWPQHHRPTTFMPVDYKLQCDEDGSATIWVGEIEPMGGTKVLTGITLRRGKAVIEISARLFNRTPEMQSFLWWANPAVAANDDYQSFFPQDVQWVADHGKRDVSTFPLAEGTYYGVNYGARTDGSNDISRYRNIPVPTSYMALGSKYDFFGGYDHGRRAGLLHFADHHVSPGKKQWTWGNAAFGQAWDRNLTDDDGPYLELMAGVFTDNQPDFTWIAPYETKTFKQYFFPFKEIGLPRNATPEAAINLEISKDLAAIAVYATACRPGARIELAVSGKILYAESAELSPEAAFMASVPLPTGTAASDCTLTIYAVDGEELVAFTPLASRERTALSPATAAPPPTAVGSVEELFLHGLHLEQYRHATRSPEPYYREGLDRDPGDSRCNNAIGLLLMKRLELEQALPYFDRAIARITMRNPNPYDGEAYYNKGICLRLLGRQDEAYDAFSKAAWNAAWTAAATYALAEIDCRRGRRQQALAHLSTVLQINSGNTRAQNLQAAIHRRLGDHTGAADLARNVLQLDPLDRLAEYELFLATPPVKPPILPPAAKDTVLELTIHYLHAGLYDEAITLLDAAAAQHEYPMYAYFAAYCHAANGHADLATACLEKAASLPADYCFPSRLEEALVLQAAIVANPHDGMAPYYLGNLLYSRKAYDAAITSWQLAASLAPTFPTSFRNLGLALFNKRHDADAALAAYERAFALNPADARVLFELDQLNRKMNVPAPQRLALLATHPALVAARDDLFVEWLTLMNLTGQYDAVLASLATRQFHPWEGGEGKVVAQYEYAHIALGLQDLNAARPAAALANFRACQTYPENLGEGKLITTPENNIDYLIGLAFAALADTPQAQAAFARAAQAPPAVGPMTFYVALARRQLNDSAGTQQCLQALVAQAQLASSRPAEIDYFAISLPDFLVFDEDLQAANNAEAAFCQGMLALVTEDVPAALAHLDRIPISTSLYQAAQSLLLMRPHLHRH